jgi:hypothetical protein
MTVFLGADLGNNRFGRDVSNNGNVPPRAQCGLFQSGGGRVLGSFSCMVRVSYDVCRSHMQITRAVQRFNVTCPSIHERTISVYTIGFEDPYMHIEDPACVDYLNIEIPGFVKGLHAYFPQSPKGVLLSPVVHPLFGFYIQPHSNTFALLIRTVSGPQCQS